MALNLQTLLSPLAKPFLRRSKAMRGSQFEFLPAVPGRVVFLGDSITEGGCWDEWFAELPTCNRGINGDTVAGVSARLASALNEPQAVSLLIGTNDLGGMGETRDVDRIAEQVRELILALRQEAPAATLLVNSVMPRVASMASTIGRLNEHYSEAAVEAHATFVDLWPALAAADGSLRDEFTADHLHLNGPGYGAWVEVLRPLLAPNAFDSPDEFGTTY
jgi:lysophospholipase L1-like esterase